MKKEEFMETFKRQMRAFNKEMEEKIGLDPEKETFVGIHIEDIGKIHKLDQLSVEWHSKLKEVRELIKLFEEDIQELEADPKKPIPNSNELQDLREAMVSDKERLNSLEKTLKTAQNYELNENDLLGVGFVKVAEEEKKLQALKNLVKASVNYLLKLRKLKSLL